MLIAEKKKKENISEYIVHMYKTEDLIRAFEYDIDKIERYMISHLPLSDEERKNEMSWYEDLIKTMQNPEGLSGGHLKEVQEIIENLENLHSQLMNFDQQYRELVELAGQDLKKYLRLANKDSEEIIGEIQVCLNAIYGYLLLKLEDRPISEEQRDTVDKFGAVLSYLSYQYKNLP